MQSVLILLALRLQILFVLQYSEDLRIHAKKSFLYDKCIVFIVCETLNVRNKKYSMRFSDMNNIRIVIIFLGVFRIE